MNPAPDKPIPAFPSAGMTCDAREPGMSIRDYFAAWALLGEYIREGSGQSKENGPYSGRAKEAYKQADAMLQEREPTRSP